MCPLSASRRLSRPSTWLCAFQTRPPLVTTTASARRAPSARPSNSSAWPLPYDGAVSKHVTPASSAAAIVRIASRSSLGPYRAPPIGHVPRPITDDRSVLCPNVRDSTVQPPLDVALLPRTRVRIQIVPHGVAELPDGHHDHAER